MGEPPAIVARLDHVGLAVADLSIEMLIHPTLRYRLELLHRP
jgi:hypothetical protein